MGRVLECCSPGFPPVAAETPVAIRLRTPSGKTADVSIKLRPHRQPKVYVALKTHGDPGYTEPVDLHGTNE
jgi:hypothetical protein